MEISRKTCRLCLNSINDENFEVIGESILEVLLLNLDTEWEIKYLLCSPCSKKLLAAFQFKSTCVRIDNIITSYMDGKTWVDLKEILLNEKGDKEFAHKLDEKVVCRLCMELVDENSEFFPFHNLSVDIVQKYIPEINFNISKDPIICKLCLLSLNVHTDSINRCLSADKKIRAICVEQKKPDIKPDIRFLEVNIKTETVDEVTFEGDTENDFENFKIKSEEDECALELIKNEMPDLQFEENRLESLQSLHEMVKLKAEYDLAIKSDVESLTEDLPTSSENIIFKCNTCDCVFNCENDLAKHTSLTHDNSNLLTLKCDFCGYKSENSKNLERHTLIHKDPVEIQTCTCGLCDHLIKRKRVINVDTGQPKIDTLKCHQCTFETKRKSSLRTHVMTHFDASRGSTFQCGKCDYKSKSKTGLKMHMMRHLDRSQLEMFKCLFCSFEAKVKGDLSKHVMRRHTPEIETYKCYSCSFETKYKYSIRNHVWTHRDLSEGKDQHRLRNHKVKNTNQKIADS